MSDDREDSVELTTRQQQLVEGAPRFGKAWPLVVLGVNVYVASGCVGAFVVLIVEASGGMPDFAEGLELPVYLWAVNGIISAGALLGFASGVALLCCADATTVLLLRAQSLNILLSLAVSVLTVVSAVVYAASSYAQEHRWTIPLFVIYSLYTIAGFALWGLTSYHNYLICAVFRRQALGPTFAIYALAA